MANQKVRRWAIRLAVLIPLATLSVASACTKSPLASGDLSDAVVVSQSNPSISGNPVTFYAVVSANSGTSTPTGAVIFKDGSTNLGTVSLDQNGLASCTTSTLSVGNHEITVSYIGDSQFAPSTSPTITQTIEAILILTTTAAPVTSSAPTSTAPVTSAPTTIPAPPAYFHLDTDRIKSTDILME